MSLPKVHRPIGLNRREFRPGIDLPRWFYDSIKAIDPDLYFVWHPFRIIYDTVMNQYTGEQDDPRFNIREYWGQEVWGYPLTDHTGEPIPERKWHIWRLARGFGWCHVSNVDSNDPAYLRHLTSRLYRNATLADKGRRAMLEAMQEEQEETLQKNQAESHQLFADVQNENKWLMKRALEEAERGNINPTRPTKHVIQSGPWSHRGTVERPITDEEGGLVLPEDWRK